MCPPMEWLPPPLGRPRSVLPPNFMIDSEFDRLLNDAFPIGHHRWRAVSAITVTVMVGLGVYAWTRSPGPSAQTVCDRLATPGLTTPEGRNIVVRAQRDGISIDDLRQQCAPLGDGFGP